MNVLITGGAGFVGHHFVEGIFRNTDWQITVMDRLSYAGSLDRLREINAFNQKRVLFLATDFTLDMTELAKEVGKVDVILHLGAETHVDRSIANPFPFVQSNVVGTMHVLQLARLLNCGVYYFSTDEVFGPAPEGVDFAEDDAHNPNNPYAATKSAGESLVKAWQNTYGVPCVITRTMNIFGERQHPEKFIPLCIGRLLRGEEILVHASPDASKSGTRNYIHARNVADAYTFLLNRNVSSGVFHVAGELEVSNEDIVLAIAKIIGVKPRYRLIDANQSRPGHDFRYGIASHRLSQLGWKPPRTFWQSLEKTVSWTLENPRWINQDVANAA